MTEIIRMSIMTAMITRKKDTDLCVHMVNGEQIIIHSNTIPIPGHDENPLMYIFDEDNGHLIMLNLEQVTFVECHLPKNDEHSHMQDIIDDLRKAVHGDNSKLFNGVMNK